MRSRPWPSTCASAARPLAEPEHRRGRGADHVRVRAASWARVAIFGYFSASRARSRCARSARARWHPPSSCASPSGWSARSCRSTARSCRRRRRSPRCSQRLPHRVQARVGDAARRLRARRGGRGGGDPARRAQHRARRRRRRRRHRRPPRHRPRALHRQHHRGTGDRRGVRRLDEAPDAGARRQGGRDPARRRADRGVAARHAADVVLQQRPGVHRVEPGARAPGSLRRGGRGRRRDRRAR